MGSIAEVSHDGKGLIWPAEVAPFDIHLVALFGKDEKKNEEVRKEAGELHESLQKEGFDVLYDDRKEVSAGVKFGEADLFGIPTRLVISEKTLDKDSVEVKKRTSGELELIKLSQIVKL